MSVILLGSPWSLLISSILKRFLREVLGEFFGLIFLGRFWFEKNIQEMLYVENAPKCKIISVDKDKATFKDTMV